MSSHNLENCKILSNDPCFHVFSLMILVFSLDTVATCMSRLKSKFNYIKFKAVTTQELHTNGLHTAICSNLTKQTNKMDSGNTTDQT